MEYHFDSEIRLLEETELKSLYTWFLQEFSKEGKALSSKLIPWEWSLSFLATELKYIRGFETDTSGSEFMRATLKPAPDVSQRSPQYSMFGTNRFIQDFSLKIHKLETEQAAEKCTVWGGVSCTYEIDFHYCTDDDSLCFYLSLKPENYDALCYFAKHGGNQDAVALTVKGVSGFYAEWSPEISTRSIKVLVADTDQNVIRQEGSIDPPRLGQISNFRLDFSRRSILYIPPAEEDDDVATVDSSSSSSSVNLNVAFSRRPTFDEKADSVPPTAPADANVALLPVIQQLQKTLKSLRVPIWLIVVLLALILSR